MSITADPALKKVLGEINAVTDIRDQEGNLLGLFTPKDKAEQLIYEKARQLFDPKELERRLREENGKGRTLEEIKKTFHVLEVQ